MHSLHKTIKGILNDINWKSPKNIFALLLINIVIFGGVYYLSQTTSAISIAINGENLGYVSSKEEAKSLINEVLSKQGSQFGIKAQTDDDIEYKKVRVKKKEYELNIVKPDDLVTSITPFSEGTGLEVDGEVIAVLQNDKAVDEVLSKYIEYQTKPSETNKVNSSEITEEVKKIKVKVSPDDVETVEKAQNKIIQGDITVTNYTVKQDDSLWLIARQNGMFTDEIIEANPNLSEESILQPGELIKISKVEPYLTVISKGERVVNETIPFDVVTTRDNSLGYGQRVIKQAGKDGEKAVTYSYVEENGKIIEKSVVEEKVLSEPEKQIVALGPNRPVTIGYSSSRGSGSVSGIIWPLRGIITSYFGYRGLEFHTGLDINGSTGQPYIAAAAGKVIYAGWKGNYGIVIDIDHGDGVVTRYAHSSKLAVSVGQQVNQGQVIGYVGSTGRSTGPHLHFEVITNGRVVNPLNYL